MKLRVIVLSGLVSLISACVINPPKELGPELVITDYPDFRHPVSRVPDCDPDWVRNEVLAPATTERGESSVFVNCNLNLASNHLVSKRLVFETSGVTLDCNDAIISGGGGSVHSSNIVNYQKDMIEIRSRRSRVNGQWVWRRTGNVTIRGCDITGSIRIWGMTTNGEGREYTDPGGNKENTYKISSRTEGHVAMARANAPTHITLDELTITGVGRNPVYFAPGVSYSKLINSELKGWSKAVGIYLDAESVANTIRNNHIHVNTNNYLFEQWDRPLIAIDASSHNRILDNRFSNLSHGGIYLYRNCGEGGVIRHTTPSYNQIINNTFYYDRYDGQNPAVYIGSRNYGPVEEVFKYCAHDRHSGSDFGSAASNRDHATENVVMQNRFISRSLDDSIKISNPSVNSSNHIGHNRSVTVDTVVYDGPAGCFVSNGYDNFLLHDESVDVFRGANGLPACNGNRQTCMDGDLVASVNPACELVSEEFDCPITGNNDGCTQRMLCPGGKKTLAAVAACNLESSLIPDADIASLPGNTLRVLRASDNVSDGSCRLGRFELQEGETDISDIRGYAGIIAHCHERDSTGGDCRIKGVLYCR